MGWIADLLEEFPAAARYKAELEGMARENAKLKADLKALRAKLAAKGVPGRLLKEDAQRILVFLQRREYATSSQIAQAVSISKDRVERYLEAFMARKFISSSTAIGQDLEYSLAPAGERYLHVIVLP